MSVTLTAETGYEFHNYFWSNLEIKYHIVKKLGFSLDNMMLKPLAVGNWFIVFEMYHSGQTSFSNHYIIMIDVFDGTVTPLSDMYTNFNEVEVYAINGDLIYL